jgi:hypothetical protein
MLSNNLHFSSTNWRYANCHRFNFFTYLTSIAGKESKFASRHLLMMDHKIRKLFDVAILVEA